MCARIILAHKSAPLLTSVFNARVTQIKQNICFVAQLLFRGGDAGGAGRDLHVRHPVRGGAAVRADRQPRHRIRLHAGFLQTPTLLGL